LFIDLTPFVPLSLKGEGEETLERGEAPLLPTLSLPLLREGGQGDRFPSNPLTIVRDIVTLQISNIKLDTLIYLGRLR